MYISIWKWIGMEYKMIECVDKQMGKNSWNIFHFHKANSVEQKFCK